MAIAGQIKRHLQVTGCSRKALIRDNYLSKSSIDKALIGRFSDSTLAKIEAILKVNFIAKGKERDSSFDGGYSHDSVKYLEGRYNCIRPLFSNPNVLTSYLLDLTWSDEESNLIFNEGERTDGLNQKGFIYVPFGKPFMIMRSRVSIRTVVVSLPDRNGLSYGAISTLYNPQGTTFVPAYGPVVLRKLKLGDAPTSGQVDPSHPAHTEYQKLLQTVFTEQYALVIGSSAFFEGRKGISVVGGN